MTQKTSNIIIYLDFILIINIINGLLVFFVAIFCSFYTSGKKIQLSLISWSFLAIAFIYGIGSIVIFTATYDGVKYLRSDIVLKSQDYWPLYGPLVLVLIAGIFLGWKIPIRTKKYINKLSSITFKNDDKKLLNISFILLLLGFVLRWVYVQPYGGFIPYLEYNKAIRSAVFEIKNPFSFLQPFSTLVILSSYFFWSLWMRRYRRFIVGLGFIFSISFSLYIYFSLAGRVGFALYLVNFILAYAYVKKIHPKMIIFFATLGFPLVIFLLYYISLYFNIKASDSISYYFIKEISFVFVTFFAQISEGDLFRCFSDFIFAPMHLLPSSFTVGLYESASETNTALISGSKKGEGGVTGGIPVDLLSLGLMQFNAFGIFPVGVLFGFIIKRLDYFLELIPNDYLKYILVSYVSFRIAFIGLLYAHPPHFMSGIFPLIILVAILYLVNVPYRIKIYK